ncbi:MAG: hypothetical protein IJN67_00435 [Oscillospiraceae bacterium]|nr:hypothetical protein [Oscillospiraceae bacterium]
MLTRKIQDDAMLFYEGDHLILTVNETEVDGGILMSLKGDLKSETAYHIQDELDAFTTVGMKVTIDFKEVVFAAPSVLNALLNSQQLIDFFRKGEIVLKNIPGTIYQEMDDTGITELLMIEE